MSHQPESFDRFFHQPTERPQHQNHPVHHSDYHHVGHHRKAQSQHDSHNMAHNGQLPKMDIVGHDTGHGKPSADKPSPATPTRPEKQADGTVKFSGLHGASVDTDGSGAKNHREDRSRQSRTSLTDEHGRSLDTDHDKFVALPKSVMKEHGIKLGDHGFLERADTGEKVPVVFGDVSSGKQWKNGQGQPEASVAALKALGFNDVNGNRGVDKSVQFNLTMDPGSRANKGMVI